MRLDVMKYNKILKSVFIGLLFCLSLIEVQYCSQSASKALALRINSECEGQNLACGVINTDSQVQNLVPDAIDLNFLEQKKRSRRPSFSIDIMNSPTVVYPEVCDNKEIKIAEKLKKFDPVIVAYWMSPSVLERIKMNEESLKLQENCILDAVIKIDDRLQRNKEKFKEELFRAEVDRVKQNNRYSQAVKDRILAHMFINKDEEKDRLWLLDMYNTVNQAHKYVQENKHPISYVAWPHIREIHTIRGFKTPYTTPIGK